MYNGIDGDLPGSTTYFSLLSLCAQQVRFLFPSRDLSQVLEIDLEYREGLDDLGKSGDFWVRPSRLVSQEHYRRKVHAGKEIGKSLLCKNRYV